MCLSVCPFVCRHQGCPVCFVSVKNFDPVEFVVAVVFMEPVNAPHFFTSLVEADVTEMFNADVLSIIPMYGVPPSSLRASKEFLFSRVAGSLID